MLLATTALAVADPRDAVDGMLTHRGKINLHPLLKHFTRFDFIDQHDGKLICLRFLFTTG